MRTEIYMWVEPMVMNHERCTDKVYFNCVVDGNHSKSDLSTLDDLLGGKTMSSIMDFADIDSNWNYGVISAKATNKNISVQYSISTDEKIQIEKDKKIAVIKKKDDARIKKLINSKYPIGLSKEDMNILDGGMIEINLPELNVAEKFDFAKIWKGLEKDVVGKIKEGDIVTLTDDDGNKIFEINGGSFLSVAFADLSVHGNHGLKGGLYIRDDGSMDIGDFKRTFWLKIYTNNLLKASLKLKKSIMEITQIKLLK